MAPTRRQSNGRSPLVNQQRQITSFFSKSPISSIQNPTKPNLNKPNPNPSPNRNPSSPNPNSPSPSTPSPVQSKPKKPLLVIGASTPSPSPSPTPTPASVKSYGVEVVGKRIKVYWPLDKSWYQGFVKSFDKDAGKHMVQYDDSEEELLNLEKEKIEWVQECVKKFKRLRRGSSLAFDKAGTENEVENLKDEEESNGDSGGGDSSDEDWGMKGDKEMIDDCEDEEEVMELDDDDDDDENEVRAMKSKGKRGGKGESTKRKMSGQGKAGSAKKLNGGEDVSKGSLKVSFIEPKSNAESK